MGAGVAVAVFDSGVTSMRDLDGRLVFGPDLSGEDSTPDTYSHGTVMAGIVAGEGARIGQRVSGEIGEDQLPCRCGTVQAL